MKQRAALTGGLAALGLDTTPAMIDRLLRYAGELEKWNRVYNLTSVPPGEASITYHLLDSLSVVPYVTGETLVDVGSGAGLPGIPLAVYFPEKRFTLLDSAGKKARFLEHVRVAIGLANVDVVQRRVEEFEGSFDIVACRAFASLADIGARTAHLLGTGGRVLAMKGNLDPEELESIVPPLAVDRIARLQVPGIGGERQLVIMKVK